jgi:hypothetical protein
VTVIVSAGFPALSWALTVTLNADGKSIPACFKVLNPVALNVTSYMPSGRLRI